MTEEQAVSEVKRKLHGLIKLSYSLERQYHELCEEIGYDNVSASLHDFFRGRAIQ